MIVQLDKKVLAIKAIHDVGAEMWAEYKGKHIVLIVVRDAKIDSAIDNNSAQSLRIRWLWRQQSDEELETSERKRHHDHHSQNHDDSSWRDIGRQRSSHDRIYLDTRH